MKAIWIWLLTLENSLISMKISKVQTKYDYTGIRAVLSNIYFCYFQIFHHMTGDDKIVAIVGLNSYNRRDRDLPYVHILDAVDLFLVKLIPVQAVLPEQTFDKYYLTLSLKLTEKYLFLTGVQVKDIFNSKSLE